MINCDNQQIISEAKTVLKWSSSVYFSKAVQISVFACLLMFRNDESGSWARYVLVCSAELCNTPVFQHNLEWIFFTLSNIWRIKYIVTWYWWRYIVSIRMYHWSNKYREFKFYHGLFICMYFRLFIVSVHTF